MEKEEATTMAALLSHPGWALLMKEVDEEIETLETRLLNETDNEVKFTEHDLNRRTRKLWLNLKEKPETIFNLFH